MKCNEVPSKMPYTWPIARVWCHPPYLLLAPYCSKCGPRYNQQHQRHMEACFTYRISAPSQTHLLNQSLHFSSLEVLCQHVLCLLWHLLAVLA